ncbi:hypothetical protein Nepgr_003969 [Nepenthes gracilis]|uniref:Uncharacterized protein n=1 Tax=Nepenthes gracilis TaxID=150966 RepID=A0AAD3XEM0_NEPGR|nr:hypothetical protein Nepgr_003969 [Nepenthes gracilis]
MMGVKTAHWLFVIDHLCWFACCAWSCWRFENLDGGLLLDCCCLQLALLPVAEPLVVVLKMLIQLLLLSAHHLDSWRCGSAALAWVLAALAKYLSSYF